MCLFCKFDDHSELPSDLWLMKECGVKDRVVRRLSYSMSGDKVLVHLTRGKLWWND